MVQNPFNGIESFLSLPSVSPRLYERIRSMELKDTSICFSRAKNSATAESVQWNWKKLQGKASPRLRRERWIRSMELKETSSQPSRKTLAYHRNPFNGIERGYWIARAFIKLPVSLNPFNGIERVRGLRDLIVSKVETGIRSMELKAPFPKPPRSKLISPESVQWNWKPPARSLSASSRARIESVQWNWKEREVESVGESGEEAESVQWNWKGSHR